jgi:hypothetical protein
MRNGYVLRIVVLDGDAVPKDALIHALRHDLADIVRDGEDDPATIYLYERESKIAQETVIELSTVARQEPRPTLTNAEYEALVSLLARHNASTS